MQIIMNNYGKVIKIIYSIYCIRLKIKLIVKGIVKLKIY